MQARNTTKTKPNSYKVLLPATHDLEGTWEVAIVNIKYPFNWPNFNEEFVAFMVSLKESVVVREKQREQQATEGETPLLILKPNADSLVFNTHWIPTPKSYLIMPTSMHNKLDGSLTAQN